MRKILFILTGWIAMQSMYAVPYAYTYTTGTGNPGGLNTEADNSLTGWIEITFSGGDASTNVWSNAILLPVDFSFVFLSGTRSQFQVSKNGCINFWPSGYLPTFSVPGDNPATPPTAPRNLVAVYWDKFTTTVPMGADDKIYYKIFGSAPNRQIWIKWYSYAMNTASFTYFAGVLEETSSKIYMVDYKFNSGGSGLSCSTGIWDYTWGDMVTASPNITLGSGSAVYTDNSYYAFDPLPPATPSDPSVTKDPDNCGAQILTRSSPFAPVVYYWQGTSCGISTANSNTTYSATANGTYYLRAQNTVTGKWSSTCASVTISDYMPRAPQPTFSVSSNTCGDKSLTLTSDVSGIIDMDGIDWYERATWQGTSCGTNEADDATADDYYISSSGTYYLRAWYEVMDIGIYSTCWSPCTSATVTINPFPSTPPVPDVSTNVCGDKIITRAGPTAGLTYYWQTTAGGTSTSNSSLTYTATTSGTYYLRTQSTAGCWSTSSASVSVTVNPIPVEPAVPTVSNNSCGDKTITRSDPPVNTTYYWQTSVSGTSTTNSSKTQTASTSSYFYLRAYKPSGCWSTASSVGVNVFAVPAAATTPAISANVCGDKTLTRDNPPINVTYYWQDSINGAKITDFAKNKIASATGTYYLRAQTMDGGCWSDNTTTLFVTVLNPFDQEKICLVTLDSATKKNRIIWERTSGKRTVSYNIYKIVSSNFTLIGNVKYDSLSVFIDVVSNPESEPFQYAITTLDSCGNESAKSPTHQTMRLWSSISTELNSANINWYKYVDASGIFVPDSFYIYKGATKEKMTLLAAQPATNKEIQIYTDNAFFGPVAYYQVGVKKTLPCSPAILKAESGPYTQSLSNIAEYKVSSLVSANGIAVTGWPNPFSDALTLNFTLDKNSNVVIEVINASGQKTAELSFSGLAAGNQQIQLSAAEMNISEGMCYMKIVANEKTSVLKVNHIK